MDLSMYLNNRIMALLPSEMDRLRAKAQAAPNSEQLQSNFEAHEAKLSAAYGDSEKPRLRNGSIGDNGVAIINIKGVLFNVESYWDEILAFYFGGCSYQSLMRDIDLVMNDSQVQAVGFHVHSPGGEAFGMNETSNKISALTAKKTTIGYAYGFAASAGYGLIAATGEIYADANAWVGSIGTVMAWADFTGFYEQLGIAYEEVTSTNAPYKRLDIRIPEERAVFMAEIDGVEDVFIKKVAKDRKFTVEKVKSDFGRGAVMAGKQARAAGMIDQIGSWDDVLKQLQTKAKKANKVSANLSAVNTGENEMSWKNKLREFFGSEEVQSILQSEDEPNANGDSIATATEASKSAEQPLISPPVADKATATVEQQLAGFKTTAEAFATQEIKAGRMSPREKKDFVENFAQAAFDDTISPLSSGTSRVERLKAQSSNRKPSLLTEEAVHSETNQVLLVGKTDENSDAKKQKLLNLTPLGKRASQSSK